MAAELASPDGSFGNIRGFGAIHPVSITVKGLGVSVTVKGKGKEKGSEGQTGGQRSILQNISLHVPAGKLMAIMGGSGSGKTTLLNALADRPVGKVSGEIAFNGEDPKKFFKSGMVAYVQQQDNLLPYITVRETLRYAARLRLPQSMALEKKYDLVESVILELGLKECANTLVGDEWRKGISGGEKRRVSVGVQLLMNPSLIFMDEPTTGLDSFSARSLIETLVSLAHKTNRTIILSIHQPRSDIFSCFDQITLLARGGRLAYCGSPRGSVRFLESVGFPLIGDMNGADFIVDTVAIDDRTEESEVESKKNVDRIVRAWEARVEEHGLAEPASLTSLNKENERVFELVEFNVRVQGAGFGEQVSVLSRRMIANMWEDRLTLWGSVLEVLIMGAVIGAIFWRPNQDPDGMYSRKSALYTCCAMQNYLGVMFMIYKLSLDMKVFDRERMDKMYSVPAYMISWVSVNFTIYGFLAVVFSVLTYFMVALRTDDLAYHFGIFTLNSVLQQWITMAFSFFCISFARDFATASLIASMSTLDRSNTIRLTCPSIPVEAVAARAACDGNTLIAATGFDASKTIPLIGLGALLVGKILIAALVLHLFPAQGAKQGGTAADKKDKKDKKKVIASDQASIEIEHSEKPPSVSLELKDLSLDFHIRKGFSSKSAPPQETKKILKSISATFPPGQLTAILGSSGAGKSTLLHLLHARSSDLPSHITAESNGIMLHNGKEFSKDAINACTASVRQDDSHLLPALTARETLRYAALLRLPSAWPKDRKIARAEEVLLELGLKECANTVVGGEGVKGGRLSVGLAMLMDPAILLLDEPTGRTVVCTIHQPRSDIFPLLDRILLLARGGRVVYQGPGSTLVPHFSSLNHQLPILTNPADFALDLASVDLRSDAVEEESRARVDSLIESWNSKSAEAGPSASSNVPLLSGEETSLRVLALSNSKQLSLMSSLPLLVSRSWLNLRRQPGLVAARVMNVFALGVIFSMYFARMANDQSGVISRIGLMPGSIVFIGMLNCIAVFPQELLLFRFEHQDGTTSVESFFLTYMINELPFEIVGGVIYGLFSIYVMGLQMNVGWMILIAFANIFAGESIGIAFCTIFSKPGFSVQIMSAVISVVNQMQGFLSVNMPSFLNILNYLSLLRYGARVLATHEFDSTRVYSCDPTLPCQYPTGDSVIKFLGFESSEHDKMLNLVGVLVSLVVYRFLAYIVMKRALP
ncbi:P-loop containing nucleoside triphosphate hydrolase protein, partial [Obelidium mucronatum]